MIRHVVLWTLKNREQAPELAARLMREAATCRVAADFVLPPSDGAE